MNKRIKSQPIAVQLELLNEEAVWNIFEEYTNMAAKDYKFEYMLLNRLQCDCNYYLGHGGRNAQHCLWAHDEQKQIDKMRELYDLLPVKPEWLTREQIDEYAARMNVK